MGYATVSLFVRCAETAKETLSIVIGAGPLPERRSAQSVGCAESGATNLRDWRVSRQQIEIEDVPTEVEEFARLFRVCREAVPPMSLGPCSIAVLVSDPRINGDSFRLSPELLQELGELGLGLFVDVYSEE